jgi:xanthine dehydrogenase/oxidase
MIETVIEHVATVLRLRPDVVREINMYKEGDVTPGYQKLVYCNAKTVFDTVKDSSNYEQRSEAIEKFNAENKWVKRGISIVPCKFLAYWESQTQNALVNVYPDGSISLHTSGCEVGQGLDIKIAQVSGPIDCPWASNTSFDRELCKARASTAFFFRFIMKL